MNSCRMKYLQEIFNFQNILPAKIHPHNQTILHDWKGHNLQGETRKKHLYTKHFSPQEEEKQVTVIVRKGKYDSLFLAVA